MKFISVLSLLIGINAYAVDVPMFAGLFKFSPNDLSLEQMQHTLSLSAGTADGVDFLNKLRQDSYTCKHIYSFYYSCKKIIAQPVENPAVRQGLIEKLSPNELSFISTDEDYELLNDAPALVELARNQKSSFDEHDFDKIHFFVIPGLIKFKLYQKTGAETAYFYLTDNKQIAQQIIISKNNKKPVASVIEDKYIYVYEAVWK